MSQAYEDLLPEPAIEPVPAAVATDEAPACITEGQEVTMSGDLQQISLSDIFQTLSISKMMGVLKVSHPLEQRMLFFENGHVKDLVFGRHENRRLGQRLIRAGLVDADDVRSALEEQRETGLPIGQALIRAGLIDADAIEDVATYQSAEDLNALFTWEQGTFEFYKGKPSDDGALSRMAAVPSFEVNRVLLEVARRSDEWDLIQHTLHSLDEIFFGIEGAESEELSGDHAAVLAALDGTRSVRELPDATMLGLFDCGRTLKDLVGWDLVEPARPDELLAVAEMQRMRGDVRRATITLGTLIDRGEKLDLANTRELAASLERCGETRLASQCLWRKAQDCDTEDPDEALELARDACRLDRRSAEVLEFLRDLLQEQQLDDDELLDVTSDLAEALLAEGREEAALETLDDLQALGADLTAVLSRKARLLQRLDRVPEAVAELTRLTEILKKEKRGDELARVYEQIMMLDGRRRDIARALISLRSSTRARRFRLVGVLLGVVAIALVAQHLLRDSVEEQHFAGVVSSLREQLDQGNLDALPPLIAAAQAEFGERPELAALLNSLTALENRRAEDGERLRESLLRGKLKEAAQLLESGDLSEALSQYEELQQDAESVALVTDVATNRIKALARRVDALSATLPGKLPPPTKPTDDSEERDAVLQRLDTQFRDVDLQVAESLREALQRDMLDSWSTNTERALMLSSAELVIESFGQARALRAGYEHAEAKNHIEARLQPVFVAAREHEASHDFQRALRAYEQLAAEYPSEDELKRNFVRRVQRYRGILDRMAAIAEATRTGAFEAAVEGLTDLAKSEPTIPFHRLVALPLRVESAPPGASVTVRGRRLGTTPLLTAYFPAGTIDVQVELEGFEPEASTFKDGSEQRLHFDLARQPRWKIAVDGPVDRRPTCDADGTAYIVDRAGNVTAVSLGSGQRRWVRATHDVNGLLPSPVVFGSLLVVASFDGRLRGLDRRTGVVVCELSGLPCEAAPAVVGNTLVVATKDGHLVGLTLDRGDRFREQFRERLDGPVEVDLTADESHVFAATRKGTIYAVQAASGTVRWRAEGHARISAAPCPSPGSIIVVRDDGSVEARSLANGAREWLRDGLGELSLPPTLARDHVVVATDRTLMTFRLADGQPGPFLESDQVWSAAPAITASGKLLAGTQRGILRVCDAATLATSYVIRGPARVHAQPVWDLYGRTVVAFGDGTVFGFDALP